MTHAIITVYPAGAQWFCSWTIDGDYDSSGPLDATTATEAVAEAEALELTDVTTREVRVELES